MSRKNIQPNDLLVIDPQSWRILIREEQWQDHVVIQHEEMTELLPEVITTIEDPDVISGRPQLPSIRYYYRRIGRRAMMRVVVVRTAESTTGELVTAHLVGRRYNNEVNEWQQTR